MNRRLLVLAVAALGLGGLAAQDSGLLRPAGGPEPIAIGRDAAATGTPPSAPRTIGNPLAGLTIASLEAITARPLFNPTRAPAPAPVAEAPPPEPAPVPEAPPPEAEPINPADFTPLAIASNDGGATAVIRWNPTGEVFRLKRGQTMEGFEVAAIGERDVTVKRDGQAVVLKLFQQFDRPVEPAEAGADPDGGAMDPSMPGLGKETARTARPPSHDSLPKGLPPTGD